MNRKENEIYLPAKAIQIIRNHEASQYVTEAFLERVFATLRFNFHLPAKKRQFPKFLRVSLSAVIQTQGNSGSYTTRVLDFLQSVGLIQKEKRGFVANGQGKAAVYSLHLSLCTKAVVPVQITNPVVLRTIARNLQAFEARQAEAAKRNAPELADLNLLLASQKALGLNLDASPTFRQSFSPDGSEGRLHHPAINLHREHKAGVRVNGEALWDADIRCAHFSLLMANAPADWKLLLSRYSGVDIYETISKWSKGKHSRNAIKKAFSMYLSTGYARASTLATNPVCRFFMQTNQALFQRIEQWRREGCLLSNLLLWERSLIKTVEQHLRDNGVSHVFIEYDGFRFLESDAQAVLQLLPEVLPSDISFKVVSFSGQEIELGSGNFLCAA